MTTPFSREDAKKRAAGCRNHAETMRGSMKERQRIADEATNDDDRRAALSCLEICRREVEYLNGKARLYDAVARGEDVPDSRQGALFT